MNLTRKIFIGVCSLFLVAVFVEVFIVRYNMKSNLWLEGTNKIIIQENVTHTKKSIIIGDPKIIEGFKKYFENTRINYAYGMYYRSYKIILTNGVQKKIYGYNCRNHMSDYGVSPGSLTLTVRIYEMESLAFNSFITSVLKDWHFDKRTLKLSQIEYFKQVDMHTN